ncbi:enoyl-CoA hydratase/isomerase family protein [Parapusillimonas granuli]|uniref:Enoyl-CoA hydratase/isomerase family protein n=1 Tax=Parapusillimonas granuli TaxID=380911 RepID=A0A853FSQ5_9BURK|nr:enoyl-CoA hydratase/isomerase family protein [Parapusillimonas granuli]MBB5214697.1 enoyl-CoA hydratase/carnithine racemase [Parapusillimonas granuli]MEB2398055.1 enoyl-CoA hydratase/isomerase family protein [Alcaligenaceae bacterium]NYT48895.1 enoyl-CoA hydratase/isomerase family protein [Parapusillimonas granuli]
MNRDIVHRELHGSAVVLTLEAPSKLNALSLNIREQLKEQLQRAHADPHVRCIVLTGANGSFSAGGDITKMAEQPEPLVARQRLGVLHDIVRLIISGPTPVVAAVEGVAYGAGLSLAVACDYVVAAEESRFSASFGRIGLVADCGLLWTLPQRVGLGLARDLLMTGRPFGVAQALEWGVVDEAAPKGDALSIALAKARHYEAIAPLAIAAVKSALYRRPASLEEALHIESDLQDFLRNTRDHVAACKAFLKKGTVQFEGR